jgi:hypothetical protein
VARTNDLTALLLGKVFKSERGQREEAGAYISIASYYESRLLSSEIIILGPPGPSASSTDDLPRLRQ